MSPEELINAATAIRERWPDALIYPNLPPAPNGWQRHPALPPNALAVDVDAVWPHDCEGEDGDECTYCYGWYRLVAWIDGMGRVHWIDPPVDNLVAVSQTAGER